VDVSVHGSLEAFVAAHSDARVHVFTGAATRSYLDADFAPGDALVFGKESIGLPPQIVERYQERAWAIPMSGAVRSLNLSNAVAIVLFEALRRQGSLATTFVE
jgi:tRNA (cytidine/uridine-2'-O-)-methyltransferase